MNNSAFRTLVDWKEFILRQRGLQVKSWAGDAKCRSDRRKQDISPSTDGSPSPLEEAIEVLVEKPLPTPVRPMRLGQFAPETLPAGGLVVPRPAVFSPSLKSLPEESGSWSDVRSEESEVMSRKFSRGEMSKSDSHLKCGKLLTLYEQEHLGLIPSGVQEKEEQKVPKKTKFFGLRNMGVSVPSKLSSATVDSNDLAVGQKSLPDVGAKSRARKEFPVRFALPLETSAEYRSEAGLARYAHGDKRTKFSASNNVRKLRTSSSESFEDTEETEEETEASSLSPSTSRSQSMEVLPAFAEAGRPEGSAETEPAERGVKLKPIIKHPRSTQRGKRHVPFKPRFILSVSQSCSNGDADDEGTHKRYIIRQVPLSPIVERVSTAVSSDEVMTAESGGGTEPSVAQDAGAFVALDRRSESIVEIPDLPGSPGTRRRAQLFSEAREESKNELAAGESAALLPPQTPYGMLTVVTCLSAVAISTSRCGPDLVAYHDGRKVVPEAANIALEGEEKIRIDEEWRACCCRSDSSPATVQFNQTIKKNDDHRVLVAAWWQAIVVVQDYSSTGLVSKQCEAADRSSVVPHLPSMPLLVAICLCLSLMPLVDGFNVLQIGIGLSNSHIMFNYRMAETLADRGHNVTLLMLSKIQTKLKQCPNVHHVEQPLTGNITEQFDVFRNTFFEK
ncbi:unnamed protein product, partial [Soboliphyme baturini]|uniref:PP1-binding domain-containing protein n=1 Tax=Soboliphyme baturini TaxID=241478 RepID=A0A183J7Q6_9BILA